MHTWVVIAHNTQPHQPDTFSYFSFWTKYFLVCECYVIIFLSQISFSYLFSPDLTTVMQPAVLAIALTSIFFLLCCFLPESPRYLAYCEMKSKDTDFAKEVELHSIWGKEDLQRKSILDLFDELKKLNLLPLMGLILVEQFIGGISILFYMKHFARLTGEWISYRQAGVIV